VKAQPNDRQPVMKIVVPESNWELAGEGYKFTEGPTAAANGEVFFADGGNQRIHKIGLDGKVTVFAENTGGADGMCFGPDGRLFACCNRSRTITAWDTASGQSTVITGDVDVNDCVVNHKGDIWFTD